MIFGNLFFLVSVISFFFGLFILLFLGTIYQMVNTNNKIRICVSMIITAVLGMILFNVVIYILAQ